MWALTVKFLGSYRYGASKASQSYFTAPKVLIALDMSSLDLIATLERFSKAALTRSESSSVAAAASVARPTISLLDNSCAVMSVSLKSFKIERDPGLLSPHCRFNSACEALKQLSGLLNETSNPGGLSPAWLLEAPECDDAVNPEARPWCIV